MRKERSSLISRKTLSNNVKTPHQTEITTPGIGNVESYDQPASLIQRARLNPQTLNPPEILYLQHTIGNKAVQRLLKNHKSARPVQDNRSVSGVRQQIQRVLGKGLAVGEDVYDLINAKRVLKIIEVDEVKGKYHIENIDKDAKDDQWVGYFDPRYSSIPKESAVYQLPLAENKQLIMKYSATPWKTMLTTYPPFEGITETQIEKFEYHFNMYMQEAARAGIEDELLEYVGSIMLQATPEGQKKLETLTKKTGIIKTTEKLQFRTDVNWIKPEPEALRAEILKFLHEHTMKAMPEELGKKIMAQTIVRDGAEIGLGFHGTGRTPNTVKQIHKGTKPRLQVDWSKLPPESPLRKMKPDDHPALFRLGQKDNELFTTVSVATNFEASTDFPLIHTWKDGWTETTDEGKPKVWKDPKDDKIHSIITLFVVGVEKGFDTNAIQQSMGQQKVGSHGEKATGPIALGDHYGYVVYERIHEGTIREAGHTFKPLARGNLVDPTNLALNKKVEGILDQMYVEKFHKGG